MLALTTDAAEATEEIVRGSGMPPGSFLRITLERAATRFAPPEISVSLAAVADAGDVQIEGLPVVVEPTAYAAIDNKVLDAQRPHGELSFEFRLYERPEEFADEGILSDLGAPTLSPQI